MLQAFDQHSERYLASPVCTALAFKKATLQTSSRLSKKHIAMDDIPDKILEKILEFYVEIEKHDATRVRLVNKRLAALALFCTLRTISVSSPIELAKLFLASHSPVNNIYLGKHVRCFELGFPLAHFPKLRDVSDHASSAFPNLNVVRFKFAAGILIYAGQSLQALLTEDTLFRSSSRMTCDSSFYRFLGQLRPQKFEWISPERHDIYLVGVYPKLRRLLRKWKTLSIIYLEGICLVEQQNLTTWNFALFAERVHIKGAFASTGPVILEGLSRLKDSNQCRLLLLEESWSTDQLSLERSAEGVAALTYGNTMVSVKRWSALNRQRLKSCATGRTLPPCVSRNSTNKVLHISYPKPPVTRSGIEFVLLIFICAILCILHTVYPQHSLSGRMHLSLFDIFGGPYKFDSKSIYWFICRDGSYLAERYCSSDSSIWFPDRSLMFHPT